MYILNIYMLLWHDTCKFRGTIGIMMYINNVLGQLIKGVKGLWKIQMQNISQQNYFLKDFWKMVTAICNLIIVSLHGIPHTCLNRIEKKKTKNKSKTKNLRIYRMKIGACNTTKKKKKKVYGPFQGNWNFFLPKGV